LCNLPTPSDQVWADCRTKTSALAVDITISHRHESAERGYSRRPGIEQNFPNHVLAIVERGLYWSPVRFGEIAARF
jgi:hypothetical protein